MTLAQHPGPCQILTTLRNCAGTAGPGAAHNAVALRREMHLRSALLVTMGGSACRSGDHVRNNKYRRSGAGTAGGVLVDFSPPGSWPRLILRLVSHTSNIPTATLTATFLDHGCWTAQGSSCTVCGCAVSGGSVVCSGGHTASGPHSVLGATPHYPCQRHVR